MTAASTSFTSAALSWHPHAATARDPDAVIDLVLSLMA
jgi:hypothetical protein